MDLDYCQAILINNVFSSEKISKLKKSTGGDGLDVSGSKVHALGNVFLNLSDKGISVGESSNILINNNIFNNNNLAIAIKDASQAFVGKNTFNKNIVDISMYVKKKIYNNPVLHTLPINKILNFKVGNNSVFYSDNLNKKFSEGWTE
jgi:parallel beta-helix repeat protein